MIDQKPWGDIHLPHPASADVCIMGIPFDGAVSCGKGSAHAPETIRNLSRYLPSTTEEGFDFSHLKVYDHGDMATDLNWEQYFFNVEESAFKLLESDKFCLFIGEIIRYPYRFKRLFAKFSILKK